MKLFFATTAALLMGAAPIQACGIYSSCSNSQSASDMILDSIIDDINRGRADRATERRHRELMRELRRRRTY
jgi:hypothetical protein